MSGAFLAPAWLAALAVVAVPMVLHLFAPGASRRIAVGSVDLVEAMVPRRSRRFRPSDRWRLLVRCLLLAVVAVVLAEPRIWRPVDPASAGWVLIDPALLAARAAIEAAADVSRADLAGANLTGADLAGADLAVFERLDAARQGGDAARLRWLVPGLPAFDAASPPESGDGDADPWMLVRAADRAMPAGLPLTLFSLDRLDGLRGARPMLARPVVWHTVTDPRDNRWVERLVVADGRRLAIVGHSTPVRTVYRRVAVGSGEVGRLTEADPWPEDDALAPVAGSSLRVRIVAAPGREVDGDFVRAAVRASADLAGIPIELAIGPAVADAAAARVVFWLSDAEPPIEFRAKLGRDGGILVEDGGPRARACVGTTAITTPGPGVIGLWRCAEVPGDSQGRVVLWRDPSGRPLLDAARTDGLLHYRYHSRLIPAWSDLVDGPAFAPWIHGILEQAIGERVAGGRRDSDRRRASPGDLVPRVAASAAARPETASAWVESLLWLAAALLFALERWLAGR